MAGPSAMLWSPCYRLLFLLPLGFFPNHTDQLWMSLLLTSSIIPCNFHTLSAYNTEGPEPLPHALTSDTIQAAADTAGNERPRAVHSVRCLFTCLFLFRSGVSKLFSSHIQPSRYIYTHIPNNVLIIDLSSFKNLRKQKKAKEKKAFALGESNII